YFHTSQLTDKSDVYSFGVVLAELITGQKPLCADRSTEEKNLATYFVKAMKENHLFEIVEPRLLREGTLEQLQAVGDLVKRCLNIYGDDRPTMKEVAMELEGLKKFKTHPWGEQQTNEESRSLILEVEQSDLYEVPLITYSTNEWESYSGLESDIQGFLDSGGKGGGRKIDKNKDNKGSNSNVLLQTEFESGVTKDLNHKKKSDKENPKRPNDEGRVSSNDDGIELSLDIDQQFNSDVEEFPVNTLRRSSRQTKLPSSLNDFIVEGKVKYGVERIVSYANLNHENLFFAYSLNKSIESTCYEEAVLDSNWIDAMNAEIEALN
ncbi:wall-associated receptor kinase 5-like protein, partial [Tanacetum coccineum]